MNVIEKLCKVCEMSIVMGHERNIEQIIMIINHNNLMFFY